MRKATMKIMPISIFTDKYQQVSYLQKGKYSKVYLYQNYISNEYVAVKIIQKHKKYSISRYTNKIYNEIKFQNMVSHPNILKIKEVYKKNNTYLLVSDYSECGDLFDFIDSCKNDKIKITFDIKTKLISQLINALNALHKCNVTHGDIKMENCLIFKEDDEYILKLTDFGYSHFETEFYHFGTIQYISPESLPDAVVYTLGLNKLKICKTQNNIYSDLWSFGVLMYNFYTNSPAFYIDEKRGMTEIKMYKNILTANYNETLIKNELVKDLLSKLIIVDFNKRLLSNYIIQHKLFTIL